MRSGNECRGFLMSVGDRKASSSVGSEVLMMLLMDSIVWENNCRGSGAALALKDLEVNCCIM